MADVGKTIRRNRILWGSGHGSLVIAFDPTLVLGPIRATENPNERIREFADSNVDGILVNLGLLRHCSESPGSSGDEFISLQNSTPTTLTYPE